MATSDELLDQLEKKGIDWRHANSAANAPGATDKAAANLNKVEREFVALRERARKAVADGTPGQKLRLAGIKTVRLTRKA